MYQNMFAARKKDYECGKNKFHALSCGNESTFPHFHSDKKEKKTFLFNKSDTTSFLCERRENENDFAVFSSSSAVA